VFHENLGILLSGRGSNFVAIADSIAAGAIPNARIAVVISNRPDAPGSKPPASAASTQSPFPRKVSPARNTTAKLSRSSR